MSDDGSGWSSKAGRTFLFRYVLSGFLGVVLLVSYLWFFVPSVFGHLLDFAVAAQALTIALLGLAIVLLRAVVRAFAVDRLPFGRLEAKLFRAAYREMNELALEAAGRRGLEMKWIEEDEEVRAAAQGLDRVQSRRVMLGLRARAVTKHDRSLAELPLDELRQRVAFRVAGKSAWLDFQYDILNSPAIDYFEAGFLWWANFVTITLGFVASAVVTTVVWAIGAHWLGWPTLRAMAGSLIGLMTILAGFLGTRRMDSYFVNYMRVAKVALEAESE